MVETAHAYAKSRLGPILIGPFAAHLGWWATLSDAEEILNILLERGVLRLLTEAETIKYDVSYGYLLNK